MSAMLEKYFKTIFKVGFPFSKFFFKLFLRLLWPGNTCLSIICYPEVLTFFMHQFLHFESHRVWARGRENISKTPRVQNRASSCLYFLCRKNRFWDGSLGPGLQTCLLNIMWEWSDWVFLNSYLSWRKTYSTVLVLLFVFVVKTFKCVFEFHFLGV